ncbi:MAG TPA: response regulator [bacterium]|mgnify:CR=1 FL=1|nr:response regulator [bacterium]
MGAADISRKSILVVDDEQDVLDFISDVLDKEYNVLTALNSSKAFSILEEVNIDLVLLDYSLQKDDIDGLEVLRILKTNPENKSLPICMVTCTPVRIKGKDANNFGASDYLEKPFHIETLLNKVEKLLSD